MAVLVAAEGVAIALLAVLVAGLLRSHARILSALYRQGLPGADRPRAEAGGPQPGSISRRPGSPAPHVVGVTPDDAAVAVSLGGGVDTLLVFLSGGCATCAELWSGIGDAEQRLPDRTRLVVVTVSPDRESPAKVRELAGHDATVVMSTGAWEDYRVPGSPYLVLIDGATGRISGEGSARTWDQALSLISDGRGDGPGDSRGRREASVDEELMAAGIVPGDPRLYHPPITGGQG